MVAIQHQNIIIALLLIDNVDKYQIDLNVQNKREETALDLAKRLIERNDYETKSMVRVIDAIEKALVAKEFKTT